MSEDSSQQLWLRQLIAEVDTTPRQPQPARELIEAALPDLADVLRGWPEGFCPYARNVVEKVVKLGHSEAAVEWAIQDLISGGLGVLEVSAVPGFNHGVPLHARYMHFTLHPGCMLDDYYPAREAPPTAKTDDGGGPATITEAEPAGLPENVSVCEDPFLSARELAERYGQKLEPLEKRLSRFRAGNLDAWHETEYRKPKEPRYYYKVAAVKHLLKPSL